MHSSVRVQRVNMIFTSITDLGMDEDDDEPVPLPNVNAAILKKVMPTV